MSEKTDYVSAIASSIITIGAGAISSEVAGALSVVNPIIRKLLDKSFSIFDRPSIAQIECKRLGVAHSTACNVINSNLEAGLALREDGFLEAPNDFGCTDADEILELTLRSIIQDAENRKAHLYGEFIGYIPFSKGVSKSRLVLIDRILAQLSFDDLMVLCLLDDNHIHCFGKLETTMMGKPSEDESSLFAALLHLKSLGLFSQHPAYSTGQSIGNIKCSSLGQQIARILYLDATSSRLANLIRQFESHD